MHTPSIHTNDQPPFLSTPSEDISYNNPQSVVLVVEDDAGLTKLIARSLKRNANLAVLSATSGEEGIKLAEKMPDTLMLIDYGLPDISAQRMIEIMQEKNIPNPYIIITGQGNEQLAVDLMKKGARDYLVKDGMFIDLLPGAVERALLEMKNQRELEKSRDSHIALEAQLRQAQKLETVGVLASGVAHEINNPIMGIMFFARFIKDRLKDMDDTSAEYADQILNESDRIAMIVSKLLTFARKNEKQDPEPIRPFDLVEDTLSLVKTVIRHDQLHLEVEVPEDLPKVMCCGQQIQQVLMNLLTNARDALNDRYPETHENKKIKMKAHTLNREHRSWVRITVEDHGCGIKKEDREHLFDSFYTTKLPDKGTGLGLSVSYGIVKDHKGYLSMESTLGQGTSFHMDLPAEED